MRVYFMLAYLTFNITLLPNNFGIISVPPYNFLVYETEVIFKNYKNRTILLKFTFLAFTYFKTFASIKAT